MAFVAYLLKALAWATVLPWWLWVCWSIIDRSFEWHYLGGGVLPLFLWAGYRTIYKRVEATLTAAQRPRRLHQDRAPGSRFIRARARNRWRDNRWKSLYPRETEDEQGQSDSD